MIVIVQFKDYSFTNLDTCPLTSKTKIYNGNKNAWIETYQKLRNDRTCLIHVDVMMDSSNLGN